MNGISALFILAIGIVQANVKGEDSMPVQCYPWDDDYMKIVTSELDKLKLSNEILRLNLELQKAQIEQLFTLVNKTKTVENLENHKIEDKNITSNGCDQLLDEFKRIEKKLDTVLMVEKTTGEVQSKANELTVENQIKSVPSNCAEALCESQTSGVYTIEVKEYGAFEVYCDAETKGGKWTVIQRRQDGSVDFIRKWAEYKEGFGDLEGEFFIGLDKLHALTSLSPHELLVELEDFEDEVRYAWYDAFAIGSEDEDFVLKTLGTYTGDAGDSLRVHEDMKFTTIDRDNDNKWPGNCAEEYHGGWWYNKCHDSNLNGMYLRGSYENTEGEGIDWYSWKYHFYSMKRVQMMIRPKI